MPGVDSFPISGSKGFRKSVHMGQRPSTNGAAVGHTLQLTLATKPRLAPGLEIAHLQTSEFIFVAKFDFPSDLSPSLPRTCPSGQGCGNSCDSVPCRRTLGPGSMGLPPSLHSASFAARCQCSEKAPPLSNLHRNAEWASHSSARVLLKESTMHTFVQ